MNLNNVLRVNPSVSIFGNENFKVRARWLPPTEMCGIPATAQCKIKITVRAVELTVTDRSVYNTMPRIAFRSVADGL